MDHLGRDTLWAADSTAWAEIDNAAMERAVQEANLQLPAYARIRFWIRAPEPFTARNGLATPNGRIRRDAVFARYAESLNALYEQAQLSLAMQGRA